MCLRCTRALFREVHGLGAVAIAAFQRIICLQPRPFMQGKLKPLLNKFFPCVDVSEQMSPDLL